MVLVEGKSVFPRSMAPPRLTMSHQWLRTHVYVGSSNWIQWVTINLKVPEIGRGMYMDADLGGVIGENGLNMIIIPCIYTFICMHICVYLCVKFSKNKYIF